MIPTMILVGAAFGRWWRWAIPLGAIGWAIVLLATGTIEGSTQFLGAMLFGGANTAVGAGLFLLGRQAFRALRPARS